MVTKVGGCHAGFISEPRRTHSLSLLSGISKIKSIWYTTLKLGLILGVSFLQGSRFCNGGSTQFPTNVDVTQLNGVNGIIYPGAQFGDNTGNNIVGVRDVNGDGYQDIAIAAPQASYNELTNNGAVTVLCGGPQFSATSNAFTILGPSNGAMIGQLQTGSNPITGGDINGDNKSDLILCTTNNCWIIYGSSDICSSGTINLANPSNAKVTVVQPGSFTLGGASYVSDLNKDGFGDTLFQAYNGQSGTIFGLLGRSDLSQNQFLTTGQFDFKIPPPTGSTYFGFPIAPIGDFAKSGFNGFAAGTLNSDATYLYSFNTSLSRTNTTQDLSKWSGTSTLKIVGTIQNQGTIQSADLDFDGNLDLVLGGYSLVGSQPRQSLYFLHGGNYPNTPGILDLSQLGSNALMILPGEDQGTGFGAAITSCDFDQDGYPDVGTAAAATNTLFATTGKGYLYFGQSGLWSGGRFNRTINFSGTGTNTRLGSSVACVGDVNQGGFPWIGSGAPTGASLGTAYFVSGDATPVIVNNQFNVTQGKSTLITGQNLLAKRANITDPKIQYVFSNVVGLCFENNNNPNQCISNGFQSSQQAALNGSLSIQQDNSGMPPGFTVTASSGRLAPPSAPSNAAISFTRIKQPPVLTCQFTIYQGLPMNVTSAQVSIADPDSTPSELTVNIEQAILTQFQSSQNRGVALSSYPFDQQNDGWISLVPSNSDFAPLIRLSATDGSLTSGSITCPIQYNTRPAIVTNAITVLQMPSGQMGIPFILGPDKLKAISSTVPDSQIQLNIESPDPENTIRCQNLETGIANVTKPLQVEVDASIIQCTPIGQPKYSVTASDGVLTSLSSSANVQLQSSNPTSPTETASTDNTIRNALIGFGITTGLGILVYGSKQYFAYRIRKSEKKEEEMDLTGADEDHKRYVNTVIVPLRKEIFEHVKTTSFLGYRSDMNTKAYMRAITKLATRMKELGVDGDFYTMDASDRAKIMNQTVSEIRKFVKETNCCSCSCFKPEIKANVLEDKAEEIAQAVRKSMPNQQNPSIVIHNPNAPRQYQNPYLAGVQLTDMKHSDIKVDEQIAFLQRQVNTLQNQMREVQYIKNKQGCWRRTVRCLTCRS